MNDGNIDDCSICCFMFLETHNRWRRFDSCWSLYELLRYDM